VRCRASHLQLRCCASAQLPARQETHRLSGAIPPRARRDHKAHDHRSLPLGRAVSPTARNTAGVTGGSAASANTPKGHGPFVHQARQRLRAEPRWRNSWAPRSLSTSGRTSEHEGGATSFDALRLGLCQRNLKRTAPIAAPASTPATRGKPKTNPTSHTSRLESLTPEARRRINRSNHGLGDT
jgi:hypothetical protein